MPRRINGALSEDAGAPIQRDEGRAERQAFDHLKAELARAFAAPEHDYRPLSAVEVIARNRR